MKAPPLRMAAVVDLTHPAFRLEYTNACASISKYGIPYEWLYECTCTYGGLIYVYDNVTSLVTTIEQQILQYQKVLYFRLARLKIHKS